MAVKEKIYRRDRINRTEIFLFDSHSIFCFVINILFIPVKTVVNSGLGEGGDLC